MLFALYARRVKQAHRYRASADEDLARQVYSDFQEDVTRCPSYRRL